MERDKKGCAIAGCQSVLPQSLYASSTIRHLAIVFVVAEIWIELKKT